MFEFLLSLSKEVIVIVIAFIMAIYLMIKIETRSRKSIDELSEEINRRGEQNIEGWKKVNSLYSSLVDYSNKNKDDSIRNKTRIQKRRRKRLLGNPIFQKLRSIPNIGNTLAKVLVEKFSTYEELKRSSIERIVDKLGVNEEEAKRIKQELDKI